jgi:Cytotoxic
VSPVYRDPPDFLSDMEVLRRRGTKRWRSPGGDRLYEWDFTHGHIEVYDKNGRHVGVADAMTGLMISKAVKGRRIDV